MLEKLKNMTIAEMVDERDFMMAILSIPERKIPEPIMEFPGYRGMHAVDEAKIFDAEMAELVADYVAGKCRVRNRRRADRKHKELPEERKEREARRKDKMYGYLWNLDCPKKRFCPESDPIKTRKYAESTRIIRADYAREQINIGIEEYEQECLSTGIDNAVENRNRVMSAIANRARRLDELVRKLGELKDPTDADSLWEFKNAVDTAEWYAFPD